jgi:hypothetical protein
LYLMRGGADAEMFWTGTEETGGYGMMDKHGEPKPAFHAKKLVAQHVRYGDWLSFPVRGQQRSEVDVVVSRGEEGRQSAVFVHLRDTPAVYEVSEFAAGLEDCDSLLKLDGGTESRVLRNRCDGTVAFDGFGVAVVTNATSASQNGGGAYDTGGNHGSHDGGAFDRQGRTERFPPQLAPEQP